ncbi:hypothetical protein ACKC9G_17320 [Pokkaliibacter sp. CJK22405]|uniref:hypothetical protein n=1 Tax=Pokkaliibacter sp. CJK22405 TaxID=3384615 RepID=UPI0039849748
MSNDCWQQLGLSPTVDPNIIRQAFLAAMKSAQSLADRHAQSEQMRKVRHAYDEALRQARRIHSQAIELESFNNDLDDADAPAVESATTSARASAAKATVSAVQPEVTLVQPAFTNEFDTAAVVETLPEVEEPEDRQADASREGLAEQTTSDIERSSPADSKVLSTTPLVIEPLVTAPLDKSSSSEFRLEVREDEQPVIATAKPEKTRSLFDIQSEKFAQPLRNSPSGEAKPTRMHPATKQPDASPAVSLVSGKADSTIQSEKTTHAAETAVPSPQADSQIATLISNARHNPEGLLSWCREHRPALYPLLWCVLRSENRLVPESMTYRVGESCSPLYRLGLHYSDSDELRSLLSMELGELANDFIEWAVFGDEIGFSAQVLNPEPTPIELLYMDAWKLCNEGEEGLQALMEKNSNWHPLNAFINKVFKKRANERLAFWKKREEIHNFVYYANQPRDKVRIDYGRVREKLHEQCKADPQTRAVVADWFTRFRPLSAPAFNEFLALLEDDELPRVDAWRQLSEVLEDEGVVNNEDSAVTTLGKSTEFLLMLETMPALHKNLLSWRRWVKAVDAREDFEEAVDLLKQAYPDLIKATKAWQAPKNEFSSERLLGDREHLDLLKKHSAALMKTPYAWGYVCLVLEASPELLPSERKMVSLWLNKPPTLATTPLLSEAQWVSGQPKAWWPKHLEDIERQPRTLEFRALMSHIGEEIFQSGDPSYGFDELCLMQAIKDDEDQPLALRYLMALMLYRVQQRLLSLQRRQSGWGKGVMRLVSRMSFKDTLSWAAALACVGGGLFYFRSVPLNGLLLWGTLISAYLGLRRSLDSRLALLFLPVLVACWYFPAALAIPLFFPGYRFPTRFGPSSKVTEMDLMELQGLIRGEGRPETEKADYQRAVKLLSVKDKTD